MQLVRNNHPGLLIEGPLDPGHSSLLDACAQMHHTNEIKYLAPERCVSCMHEITQQKSPIKQVELDADRLIVKDKSEVPDEAAHSALQVKEKRWSAVESGWSLQTLLQVPSGIVCTHAS